MDVMERLVELITDKENDLVRKIAWLSDSCDGEVAGAFRASASLGCH